MRRARITLITVFLLLLVLPFAQRTLRFVPEVALHGTIQKPERPQLSWSNWWSGKLQQQVEARLNSRIGFRGAAIRTDNQIGLSIFHEAFSKAYDHPVLGRDFFVFEDEYIRAYNGLPRRSDRTLDRLAANVRALQDACDRLHVPFCVIISPSKVETYREFLPDGHVLPDDRRGPTVYAQMKPMLDRHGVRTIDGHLLFAEQKKQSPHLLFAPGGIHWNRYGAQIVLRHAWDLLEQQAGRPFPKIICRTIAESDTPDTADTETDVADLLNAWHVGHGNWKYPRPELATENPGNKLHPRVLLVGDSFSHILQSLILKQQLAEQVDLYYYFNSLIHHPGNIRDATPIDRKNIDWQRDVFTSAAIILEANECQLAQTGFGFVEEALNHLPPAPSP